MMLLPPSQRASFVAVRLAACCADADAGVPPAAGVAALLLVLLRCWCCAAGVAALLVVLLVVLAGLLCLWFELFVLAMAHTSNSLAISLAI
jgi:hypothetical protein